LSVHLLELNPVLYTHGSVMYGSDNQTIAGSDNRIYKNSTMCPEPN